MIIVAPCPLDDDYEITPAVAQALAPYRIRVVARPAGDPAVLAQATVLVSGLEHQQDPPLAFAQAMPHLRWIHTLTAGFGPLLSAELVERGILVTNASGAMAVAIAEYACASLVMLARGLPELLLGRLSRSWLDHRLGWELDGKRVGIIGLGGVGTRLAHLLTGVGMRVSAVSRRPERHLAGPVERLVDPSRLGELLESCDAVILCASHNPSTDGLLGEREFNRFKPGSIFVNVSRGALVDETALAGALRSGRLAGAILDVTVREPLPAESPLWDVPNLWITPHMAGGTREGRARALGQFIENLGHFAGGDLDAMINRVDIQREMGRTRA